MKWAEACHDRSSLPLLAPRFIQSPVRSQSAAELAGLFVTRRAIRLTCKFGALPTRLGTTNAQLVSFASSRSVLAPRFDAAVSQTGAGGPARPWPLDGEQVTQAALIPVAHTIGTEFRPGPRSPQAEHVHWDSYIS
jgi:hypothetical protein